MIERNDSGEVTYINCGIGSDFAIWAESSQPLDYEDEIFIGCTDTTARYIDMLEELIGIAKWVSNSDFGARSQQAKYIITYAEGNDG